MYKTESSELVFSPSDLVLFMQSPFASWMERYALDRPDEAKQLRDPVDPMMALLAEKGNVHETEYLGHLKQKFGIDRVATIERDQNTASTKTLEAMQQGFDVIFQAYLERDQFKGYADFLIKRPGKSSFGDYYYEAWDSKLSRSTRAYFIVQLCCYTWMLEAIQGYLPKEVVVVLGDKREEGMRIPAHYAYFLNLKQRFLDTQTAFTANFADLPDPVFCSEYGRWSNFAEDLLEKSDALTIVAGIRKVQIKKLHAADIKTLPELANARCESVKGMAPDTFNKIKAQASIQLESRKTGKSQYKVIPTDHGKGLYALPPHSDLDVFFDIEGHPLFEGGLEYLWGISFNNPDAAQGKQYAFKDWWAHDHHHERIAFENFIDWVYARWQQDPTMHVYHYASYEITAINKIANREQTRLNEVADLLANKVFVDLYRVVQSGLLVGERSYSIKKVEHLYRGKRTTEVANGGESTVFYEKWRIDDGEAEWQTRPNGQASWASDPDRFDWNAWPILKAIRDYNIDDCESTLELVNWLREVQRQHCISYLPADNTLLLEIEKTERQKENNEKRLALLQRQQNLIDRYNANPALQADPRATLLVDLLKFYERERKPQGFAYFQRMEKSDPELIEDDTVIFDVGIQSTSLGEKKLTCTGIYDLDQPIRKDKIKSAIIKNTNVSVSKINFEEVDAHHGQIRFEIDAENDSALDQTPLVLFGNEEYINTDTLENRLCEITEQYLNGRPVPRLLETLLDHASPRLNKLDALPVTRDRYPDDQTYSNGLINAVMAMDETVLCIQGPPGAGKTYSAKLVIKALLDAGMRVGVMSNSHAAIMNVLHSLAKDLPDTLIAKVGGYDSAKAFQNEFPEEDYPGFRYRGSMSFTKAEPMAAFGVLGATVYQFAKDQVYAEPLDYLFVDEASQVALANLVTVAGAARNIILMGDQMQLEQPIQGSHPGNSGLSALEYMLQGHAVIPENLGIFLERTYRMHPKVCEPLSEVVYEDRLKADPPNIQQKILIPKPTLITKSEGILYLPIEHEGNTQSSEEEAEVCEALIQELLTGQFQDKHGHRKNLTEEDILVVAPYNMQVNLLKGRLDQSCRVGTIDKFQGQEAPVVIISMAVSDVSESPRGLDFIFDINRLNVAVSRAQGLAIIVANQNLGTEITGSNIKQIMKIGFYNKIIFN